ncbi:MAG TPA: Hsp20/alpha crystallin family protein [Candidatus Paceibacterota bacterium]|nr:Hsp20/alpha crystallin family protein [Candidatus Paceibacterota bacterium]
MESNDEKFFETIANGGNPADAGIPAEEAFEVKLAKAGASAMATRQRAAAPKAREREAAAWDDAEGPEGQLTVDVYQTPDDIVVESAIAGVRPEDIDVSVTTDSISIKGARHREETVRDEDYLYQECYWGRFARSIILPQEVDPENAEVTFRNGILTVRLPKVNKKKTRKLKVRID